MSRSWLLLLVLAPALTLAGARLCPAVDAEHDPEKAGSHKSEPAGKAPAAHAKPDPFAHVIDTTRWQLFESFGPTISLEWAHFYIGSHKFQLTKYMVLEVIAALLVAAIYIPLAGRVRGGEPLRGGWDNAFESLLTFIRDDVAKPNLGEHDADKHVPFLWTLFLFILFNNLLGMFPFLGSATASIWVTGALALTAFAFIHGAAVAKMGLIHYLHSLWPPLDIPVPVMGTVIKLLIFVIELIGHVIKTGVLAVRLFANMLAGHAVLSMIMLFIVMASNAGPLLWGTITVASVLGVAALSLLELFVAFLQAYIFTFLTALFMGMTMHPEH